MRQRSNINGNLTAWSTDFEVMRDLEGRPCDRNGADFKGKFFFNLNSYTEKEFNELIRDLVFLSEFLGLGFI